MRDFMSRADGPVLRPNWTRAARERPNDWHSAARLPAVLLDCPDAVFEHPLLRRARMMASRLVSVTVVSRTMPVSILCSQHSRSSFICIGHPRDSGNQRLRLDADGA